MRKAWTRIPRPCCRSCCRAGSIALPQYAVVATQARRTTSSSRWSASIPELDIRTSGAAPAGASPSRRRRSWPSSSCGMTASGTPGFRCGTIAIIGRPNVGKSTLLNALVGHKVSITSRKPQTTRHRITGILTRPERQYVFVDTPGFQTRHGGVLNRADEPQRRSSLQDVDLRCSWWRPGGTTRRPHGARAAARRHAGGPRRQQDRSSPEQGAAAAVPRRLSKRARIRRDRAGQRGEGAQPGALLKALRPHLPEQPPMFAADDITDRSERFLAAELVREKLFRQLGDELPYGARSASRNSRRKGSCAASTPRSSSTRTGHKAIVIGKGGEKLKLIATDARRDMEKLFGGKVFLEVWVKVRRGWTRRRARAEAPGVRAVHERSPAGRAGRIRSAQPTRTARPAWWSKRSPEPRPRVAGRARRAPPAIGAARRPACVPAAVGCPGPAAAKCGRSCARNGTAASHCCGRALLCGFYLNELLLKLLPREDPHEALFDD